MKVNMKKLLISQINYYSASFISMKSAVECFDSCGVMFRQNLTGYLALNEFGDTGRNGQENQAS